MDISSCICDGFMFYMCNSPFACAWRALLVVVV